MKSQIPSPQGGNARHVIIPSRRVSLANGEDLKIVVEVLNQLSDVLKENNLTDITVQLKIHATTKRGTSIESAQNAIDAGTLETIRSMMQPLSVDFPTDH
jgi:hypothetical protein